MREPRIVRRLLRSLKASPSNARKHPKKQLKKLAAIIKRLGVIGLIVIDDNDIILAGHGRREAALMAGIETIDCLVVDWLNEAEKRAFALADNRIGLDAVWDEQLVFDNLQEIAKLDIDFDLRLTGFDLPELDNFASAAGVEDAGPSPRDEAIPALDHGLSTCKIGDLILLGDHRLHVGDSRERGSYSAVLGAELASMVVSDAPYNVKIQGHVGGSGKIKHHEFVMGAGEWTSPEFTTFLREVFVQLIAFTRQGSIHFQFMDWRHAGEMLTAAESVYSEQKNLIVWDKGTGGMGTFYRSAHELIFVFKNGQGEHINNFGLGEGGRYRTNVWRYRGLNSGGSGRRDELKIHPTAKPVQMLADAMLDCSGRGDIVLDPFGGSGSTMIAAQKTGRRARLIELDPIYADRIVRRWQTYMKDDAVFADSSETFDERTVRYRSVRSTCRPGKHPTSRIVDFGLEVRT